MLFDKAKLDDATSEIIGSSYRKILFVDLTNDKYQPVTIDDTELSALGEKKIIKTSDYWNWFCNSELVHKDDRKRCLAYKPKPGSHLVYRRKFNNVWRWVLMELIPTKDYSEKNQTCTLYVRDINKVYVSEYEALVEKIGTTDSMTGLLNKYALDRDRQKFKDAKVGIVYADINGLKQMNDEHGHKAGDELILRFSSLLSFNFGNYKCYHISGDEFVVCAFDVSFHEFLNKAIAFHRSIWVSTETPIASVGYSIGEPGELELALQESEREMYDDKRIFYGRYPNLKRN